MRPLTFGVVLVACAGILAPALRAGSDQTQSHVGPQQWRIFPRAPFRRAADEEITTRFTRQIDPLVSFFQPEGSEGPETVATTTSFTRSDCR
jgi:hypothetical protein